MLCDFKCHLKFKVSFVKYIYIFQSRHGAKYSWNVGCG